MSLRLSILFALLVGAASQTPSTCAVSPYTVDGGSSTVIFVAADGDDSAAGSEVAPFATIAKALESAGPGVTINLRGGVYGERVLVEASGAAGSPLIIQAYPSEVAVIDGSSLTVPTGGGLYGLVEVVDQEYVIVQGLEIREWTTASASVPVGVKLEGATRHATVRQCRIHAIETVDGNAHGISVYGRLSTPMTDITIDSNEVYETKTGQSEVIVINGNVEGFAVTNNHVHHCDNLGIDVIGNEGTAATDDHARHGIIERNVVHHIDTFGNPTYSGKSAAGIYVDGGRHVLIRNNIVFNCNFGLELASEHSGEATINVTAVHNIFYLNDVVGVTLGGYDSARGSTDDCRVENNVMWHNDVDRTYSGEMQFQYDVRNSFVRGNVMVASENDGGDGVLWQNYYVENTNNDVDGNTYYTPFPPVWGWRTIDSYTFADWQANGNDASGTFVAEDLPLCEAVECEGGVPVLPLGCPADTSGGSGVTTTGSAGTTGTTTGGESTTGEGTTASSGETTTTTTTSGETSATTSGGATTSGAGSTTASNGTASSTTADGLPSTAATVAVPTVVTALLMGIGMFV